MLGEFCQARKSADRNINSSVSTCSASYRPWWPAEEGDTASLVLWRTQLRAGATWRRSCISTDHPPTGLKKNSEIVLVFPYIYIYYIYMASPYTRYITRNVISSYLFPSRTGSRYYPQGKSIIFFFLSSFHFLFAIFFEKNWLPDEGRTKNQSNIYQVPGT